MAEKLLKICLNLPLQPNYCCLRRNSEDSQVHDYFSSLIVETHGSHYLL